MTAKLSMPKPELSCFIGSLFASLDPPCHRLSRDEIVLCGMTMSGKRAEIKIDGDTVYFEGDADDLSCSRYGRCLNEDLCGMSQLRSE